MTRIAPTKEIFSFENDFIENLHVLPNGNILLSTLDSSGLLYIIDPDAAQPVATPTTDLPSFFDITGITGIVWLRDDLYAVSGGIHTSFAFEMGSMFIFLVALKTKTVIDSIPVPDSACLNGLTAHPAHPHILLSADSIAGRIIRINISTKVVSIALEDEALHPGKDAPIPLGINGIRARGESIYFTNSALGTFARMQIDEEGNKVGEIEVIARSPSAKEIYDDFAFDSAGNAYVAAHPSSVFKIAPNGKQTLLSGGLGSSVFHHPTSVALAKDENSIYVSTGGAFDGDPKTGGQIVQVWI